MQRNTLYYFDHNRENIQKKYTINYLTIFLIWLPFDWHHQYHNRNMKIFGVLPNYKITHIQTLAKNSS